MDLSSVSTQPAMTTSPRMETGRRLQGNVLVLARVVWIALAILTLAVLVTSLPSYVGRLQSACTAAPCVYGQLSLTSARALHDFGLSTAYYTAFSGTLAAGSAVVWFGVGVVIFWRTWGKSDDWFALLVALLLVLGSLGSTSSALAQSPWVWQWSARFLLFLGKVLAALVFSLFPDGRFVPNFTRWLVIVWAALMGFLSFFSGFPFAVNLGSDYLSGLIGLVIGLLVCFLGAQLYRYRQVSGPLERQQTRWVVFGIVVGNLVPVGVVLPLLLFPSLLAAPGALSYDVVLVPVVSVFSLLMPLSVGIAILRYRLWDIDVLLNRTLVYGTLTVCVVALYVLVVGSLGVLLQNQGNFVISLLATGLIAVLFQPLRARLQRAVNRLMYGERDDPYAVLSRLGKRLEITLAPEAVLPTIVETVAQALKVPYAAIALSQGDTFTIVAAWGLPQDELFVLPLVYQSERIGRLLLTPRVPDEAFTAADHRLLEQIAYQAGVAAHAVRLTADLQRSRERLVSAREEERRRLRRDLHDELGPTLASLTLRLDAARNLLKHDTDAADKLLSELKFHMQATVADIRRLVYDLRPPALDELGLLSALREQAMHYSQFNGLHISLEAPERLPELSAAVEVAAYRIALEALTNVARHAQAHTCHIRLSCANGLDLEIVDDGLGLPKGHRTGVGMSSMRERAAELGGFCVIEARATAGTRVWTHLPLLKE
jgi:signal transduction histidine kinase